MSPFSAPVLGAAAIVSGPALWGAFVDDTTPLQVALERFGVCVVLAWMALAALAMLVGPPPRPSRVTPEPATGTTEAAPDQETAVG